MEDILTGTAAAFLHDAINSAARGIKRKFEHVPLAPVRKAPKNYKAFDSRKEVLDQIVKALKDPTIGIIGVYGPGGVGKTTLVKEVARQVEGDNLFGPVVEATVTQTPNIENIQHQIADLLDLKFEAKTIPNRARQLSERLKEEKKILVVLDDLWDELNLEEVGIRFGDQHKGCKILLTSRNRDVLTNKMEAAESAVFPITDLKEEEAWDLFKKMAGNDFENSDLLPVATKVAKRCAGLPLAIVTVATALRNKKLAVWKDALLRLQRPSAGNFEGITKKVYSAIRLSYDMLESEELRKTFLLSCLLGRDANIEDLLGWAMGLRLFDGVNTVAETRNRVLTMVSELKASCLLLDGYNDDRLVMHDLVWDFALAIAKRDNHAFVLRQEDVFEGWPDEEEMQNFRMICLRSAGSKKLPHELECPQLTLFSMAAGRWDSYVEMPPSFFEQTKKIEVLDLRGMDFSSSPSSVSLPTSLRTLCLRRCKLGDVASLGELKNLEILNLSESDIEVLPEQIGQLTKLRSLDLTACEKLKIIPPGVLSSLSRLEELFMGKVIVLWNQQGNADLDELKELSEKLERYHILIGVRWFMWERFEYSRILAVKLNSTVDHLDDGIKGLLKKTVALHLVGSTSVPQHELPLFGEQIELPLLKDLRLDEIKVAGRIWHNQFSTLENLTNLEIIECDNLKGILSSSMAKSLARLKSFKILSCERLEEIIFDEDIKKDDNVTISFPSLKKLLIRCCPKLKGFIYKSTIEDGIPLSMQAVFDEKIELPCLEDLHLSMIDVVGRIWHKQFSTLENLTSLKITNCDNLKGIFSSSMVKNLTHLKSFEISECECLREIIFSEDTEEDDNVTISFPQLSTLRMCSLGHFIGFCSENYNLAFPSLEELSIINCPKLNGFIYKSTTEDGSPLSMQALFDEKVTFPQLEELELDGFKNCRKIWNHQFQFVDDSFSKLKKLYVRSCDGLLNIFPFNMSESLKNLEILSLSMSDIKVLPEQIGQLTKLRSLNLTACRKLEKIPPGVLSSLSRLEGLYMGGVIVPWNREDNARLDELKELSSLTDLHICFLDAEIVPNDLVSEKLKRFDIRIGVEWNNRERFGFSRTLKLKVNTSADHLGDGIKGLLKKTEVLHLEGSTSVHQHELPLFGEQIELPCLEDLHLSKIDVVERIWHKQFSTLEKLTSLEVTNCDNLKAIFSPSMVKNLMRLKSFKISECKRLREIIFSEDIEEDDNVTISFPLLCTLRMENLGHFIGFCSENYNIAFPSLKELTIEDCPKLNGFIYKSTSEDGSQLSMQSLFDEKIELPCLEDLRLSKIDVIGRIWHKQFSTLENLTYLQIMNCSTLRCLFTISIVLDLPNLSSLGVKNCSVMEHIILDNGPDEGVEKKIVLPRLRFITLESCVDLASFYQGSKILKCPSLEGLFVIDCPKMFAFTSTFSREQSTETIDDGGNTSRLSIDAAFFNNMVEFPRLSRLVIKHLGNCKKIWHDHLIDDSFSKLNRLEVRNCDKLLHVFPFNMSQRLLELELLVVGKCDSLKEIFEPQVINADELHTETATESIVFTNLWRLQLSCLPSLASFCSGKHNFEFPALDEMIVSECPKMKNFCQGDLSAPQLQEVILTEDKETKRWEGDLKK